MALFLRGHIWQVLVNYTGKTVCLFSHAVPLAETLKVCFVGGLVGWSEGLPRLSVNIASPFAGLDASCHPFVGCFRFE